MGPDDADHESIEAPFMGLGHAGRNHIVVPLRVCIPKYSQAVEIQSVRIHLALHGVHPPTSCYHKIDLPAGLVPPIAESLSMRSRAQQVEHQMLPERAAFVLAQIMPASAECDKTGIKCIHLGPANQLSPAPPVKGL